MSPPFYLPRLAIVGCGALGSALCRLLLDRGHPQVLLIDPDKVAPHNLALGRLFQQAGPACIGKEKVSVLQQLAHQQNLDWQAIPSEIADVGLTRLSRFDVLLSCPDSALARVETAFAARSLRLPMIDGAVQSRQIQQGRVTWFSPQAAAACYFCGLPETRRAELLAYALSPSLGCLPPPEIDSMASGSLATLEATAEALLNLLDRASEILQNQTPSFALRLEHGAAPEHITLTPSSLCPWHTLPAPGTLIPLPHDQPMRASLAPGEVLELAWPLCLHARCLRCGTACKPRLRTAYVRRTLTCPACGVSGSLEPLEILGRLTAEHPLAGATPPQLGLPPDHLYHRRRKLFAP